MSSGIAVLRLKGIRASSPFSPLESVPGSRHGARPQMSGIDSHLFPIPRVIMSYYNAVDKFVCSACIGTHASKGETMCSQRQLKRKRPGLALKEMPCKLVRPLPVLVDKHPVSFLQYMKAKLSKIVAKYNKRFEHLLTFSRVGHSEAMDILSSLSTLDSDLWRAVKEASPTMTAARDSLWDRMLQTEGSQLSYELPGCVQYMAVLMEASFWGKLNHHDSLKEIIEPFVSFFLLPTAIIFDSNKYNTTKREYYTLHCRSFERGEVWCYLLNIAKAHSEYDRRITKNVRSWYPAEGRRVIVDLKIPESGSLLSVANLLIGSLGISDASKLAAMEEEIFGLYRQRGGSPKHCTELTVQLFIQRTRKGGVELRRKARFKVGFRKREGYFYPSVFALKSEVEDQMQRQRSKRKPLRYYPLRPLNTTKASYRVLPGHFRRLPPEIILGVLLEIVCSNGRQCISLVCKSFHYTIREIPKQLLAIPLKYSLHSISVPKRRLTQFIIACMMSISRPMDVRQRDAVIEELCKFLISSHPKSFYIMLLVIQTYRERCPGYLKRQIDEIDSRVVLGMIKKLKSLWIADSISEQLGGFETHDEGL